MLMIAGWPTHSDHSRETRLQGRWAFEFDYTNGKMWQDFGKRGQPSKWVTLRALRVLRAAQL